MALTVKSGMSGYSKIEQKDFSGDTFTKATDSLIDDTAFSNAMDKIENAIGKIVQDYQNINAGLDKCLKCTKTKQKMTKADGEVAKTLLKFENKSQTRATSSQTRKNEAETLEEKIINALEAAYATINVKLSSSADAAEKQVDAENSQSTGIPKKQ